MICLGWMRTWDTLDGQGLSVYVVQGEEWCGGHRCHDVAVQSLLCCMLLARSLPFFAAARCALGYIEVAAQVAGDRKEHTIHKNSYAQQLNTGVVWIRTGTGRVCLVSKPLSALGSELPALEHSMSCKRGCAGCRVSDRHGVSFSEPEN